MSFSAASGRGSERPKQDEIQSERCAYSQGSDDSPDSTPSMLENAQQSLGVGPAVAGSTLTQPSRDRRSDKNSSQ